MKLLIIWISHNDFNLFNSVSIQTVLKDRFNERKSEIIQEASAAQENISDLELQKKQSIEAFKAATSDFMRETFEKEAIDFDSRIKAAGALSVKLGINENDIDDFIGYTKTFIEHPAKLLLNTANTRQQVSLYSLIFDTLPSVPELDSRTPKLSWIIRLSEHSNDDESVLAGPVGIEPTLSVLETDVLPLNYGPELRKRAKSLKHNRSRSGDKS